MSDYDTLEGVPRSKTMTILFDMRGATLYMTRSAIRDLADNLYRISEANPKECFEVHIGQHFSNFDEKEEHHRPRVRLAEGLWARAYDEALRDHQRATDSGEIGPDWRLGPFEVTIMHVSPEAVEEESALPDE